HAGRPYRGTARHGPHRRGLARLRARGDALGDRRRDARASDPVRGHRRGGDGRRRSIAQPLDEGGPGRTRRHAEAGPATVAMTQGTDSHLGAALGLTDADLVEMYRYVALARAVDERMWILNRAGRIP